MLYLPNAREINNFDADYQVIVNGMECVLNTCPVSAMPFNRLWPGKQRDKSQLETAYFINIFGDETINIKVKNKKSFNNAILRPLSKKIPVSKDGDTVSFTINKNGNYVLEFDNYHIALHIFYSEYKRPVNPEDVTYYFGPGIHKPLCVTLKSNESMYVHPEAIVYTTVYCTGQKNVHIFGGGILDNSCQERVDSACLGDNPIGNIRIYNSQNIHIEDVILRDSANWVCALFECKDVLINNIKIVGQWRYNTDGIDLTNTSDVSIKNSFIRSFDDSICVKATHNFDICENIKVENCVCWCDWGKTLELGLETAAMEYRNISYKNCDLIHNKAGALAISNGHYADIHNISYEDISVEYQKYNQCEMLQVSDDQIYPADLTNAMAFLFRLDNTKFSASYSESLADEKDKNYGHTHDIIFKNINVYCDEDMSNVKILLLSHSSEAPIDNITFENITLDNKAIDTLDFFDIIQKNAKTVVYNGIRSI